MIKSLHILHVFNTPLLKDDSICTPFRVPLTAFTYRLPAEGLPCLSDWTSHSLSIWTGGYEAWRESVEFKGTTKAVAGLPMSFGCLEASKGTGRVSILLYTILQTYFIKNQLEGADLDKFKWPLVSGNLKVLTCREIIHYPQVFGWLPGKS